MSSKLKVGDNVFVSYLDDNNLPRSAFLFIIDINENSISFQTKEGVLFLPVNRILKIKKRGQNENL